MYLKGIAHVAHRHTVYSKKRTYYGTSQSILFSKQIINASVYMPTLAKSRRFLFRKIKREACVL